MNCVANSAVGGRSITCAPTLASDAEWRRNNVNNSKKSSQHLSTARIYICRYIRTDRKLVRSVSVYGTYVHTYVHMYMQTKLEFSSTWRMLCSPFHSVRTRLLTAVICTYIHTSAYTLYVWARSNHIWDICALTLLRSIRIHERDVSSVMHKRSSAIAKINRYRGISSLLVNRRERTDACDYTARMGTSARFGNVLRNAVHTETALQ